MQLEPGERSILSYFPSSEQAQKAAAALKSAGVGVVQVDRVSRYGVEIDGYYNNPINRAETITGPVLYSTNNRLEQSADNRVLLGADPSVSGYGAEEYGVGGGRSFMVTVVTNEGKLDQAVDIIKQNGGMV
ncbi:hypothetical protein [Pelotomaculum propionicicum]|nr:hypothetical protein [Pelotomaculum propionicicum]NLI13491.1 hypothetical protein [Peptococcaceae bacterium]